MSYYSKYTCTPILEDTDFKNFLDDILRNEWDTLKSRQEISIINKINTPLNFFLNMSGDKIERSYDMGVASGYNTPLDEKNTKTFKGTDGEEYITIFGALVPVRKIKALKKLTFIMGRLLIGFLINRFADMKLSKFTINKLSNNMKNKKFVKHLQQEIQGVYKKHPNYSPCNESQFKKTPIYNYMLAEYRDKTSEEVLKKVSIKSFDILIGVIVSDLVPLPGSNLLAIPIRAALTYAGVRLNGLGSIYHLVTDLGGQVMKMDLILAKDGFRLSNMAIFCFNKESNLIQVDIKDPPYDTYKMTTKEAKEILNKYINSTDLKIFKRGVKELCPA